MGDHPYQHLPDHAFWSRGVAAAGGRVPGALYQRKWEIAKETRIATAGSCFAQHIGRRLRKNGYHVLDLEPAPAGLPENLHAKYGYSIYSARYGNIYTVRQLLQLAREACGLGTPGEIAWQSPTGAWHDALRPGVEPDGLGSADEVLAHRAGHLAAVRSMLEGSELIIFTLGLTEAWIHRESGTVFPTAPGTIAGDFDAARYQFHNFTFSEVYEDFLAFRDLVESLPARQAPPRFLLTVSPVPLTATASGRHVMEATVYSKSVLRAVAGQLAMENEKIDYFPSFEIVCNPWGSEPMYEANLRSVREQAVNEVMATFFRSHLPGTEAEPLPAPKNVETPVAASEEDVVCEEVLLEAFRGGPR